MDTDRIGFFTPQLRVQFFESSKGALECLTWNALYQKFGIVKSNFEFYRAGKRLIPNWLFLRLLNSLPLDKHALFRSDTFSKPCGWGRKLGGQRTSILHPELIEQGRKQANKKRYKHPKYNFNVSQALTPELCEFIGAFAGDGFTNCYGHVNIVDFAGHAILDREYYDKTIIPIAKKLFSIDTCGIYTRKNGLWVNFHSKRLFEMLTQRFKLPAGVKFDKVLIPQEILDSTPENITAVLRGMFDTDGCVFFDKRKVYKVPYLRICLTMKNPPILNQVVEQLAKLGVHGHLSRGRDVHIISRDDIKKFLHVVGFSNPKHIHKVIKAYPDFNNYNPGTRLLLATVP